MTALTVVPVPAAECFFVSSSTSEGVWYRVDKDGCSCPAGRHHRPGAKFCKHVTACTEQQGREQAAHEQLAPAPAPARDPFRRLDAQARREAERPRTLTPEQEARLADLQAAER